MEKKKRFLDSRQIAQRAENFDYQFHEFLYILYAIEVAFMPLSGTCIPTKIRNMVAVYRNDM